MAAISSRDVGQIRIAEDLAGRGRSPAGQEHARELAEAPEARRLLVPVRGDHRRDGEAPARVGDGRRQQLGERPRPEAAPERRARRARRRAR